MSMDGLGKVASDSVPIPTNDGQSVAEGRSGKSAIGQKVDVVQPEITLSQISEELKLIADQMEASLERTKRKIASIDADDVSRRSSSDSGQPVPTFIRRQSLKLA